MSICMPTWFLRHSLPPRKSIYGYRCITSLSSNLLVDDSDNFVVVEGTSCSRTAILNRPSSLNAINTPMVAKLLNLYKNWEHNSDIRFVVLKGRGKAFSAGGDVVSLYNLIKEGNLEECKQLIRMVYSLIYFISNLKKPNVATLNGITMGGGAGISISSHFRVATDKTTFATPETLIGFHPDGGASFYLSRLPGRLGEYLALTGERLTGAEMISCGLATHYSHITKLPLVEKQLEDLGSCDSSVIDACLGRHGDPVPVDQTNVVDRIETVDKCFGHDTVEEIIESLVIEADKAKDPWCALTVKKLKEIAPLSLKVALRSIRGGRSQTLEECLVREYRMTLQALSGKITNDFCEGVRAKLVDKDFAPKWDPPSLKLVSQDMVDQYFSPVSAFEPELELPTK